jgi:hypothetical protein
MRLFYKAFPICDALRPKLSWTHYRLLLRVDDPQAREWYVREASEQNWSTRQLERQIGTLYYERLLSSKDRRAVQKNRTACSKIKPSVCPPGKGRKFLNKRTSDEKRRLLSLRLD